METDFNGKNRNKILFFFSLVIGVSRKNKSIYYYTLIKGGWMEAIEILTSMTWVVLKKLQN